jgi:hypothetical protein
MAQRKPLTLHSSGRLRRRLIQALELSMAIIATAKQCVRIGEPGHVEGRAPKGQLSAVFEDDGDTGYFYALDYAAGEQPIVDALHIYNVASVADANTPSEVLIGWSLDGSKAVLLINEHPHAVLDFSAKRGYCRTGFPQALPNAGWSGHTWSDQCLELFAGEP